ncbi:2-keto-4-pentenoate hydratase [Pelagibacterium lacus]|uniref:2-keto-4-pentenoate hydratase n=1 Tax=Pelagibacterium lacus TaxID=2282655 RepID=UPI0011C07863|nr:hypothetical protein [Pelagibacterium lacus]
MTFPIENFAASLANAWKTQTTIALSEPLPSRQIAYAVQDRFFELSGEKSIGWKVGAAARTIQIEHGHDGPIPGRMPAAHFYRSPAKIHYEALPGSQAECEFAFRVTRQFTANRTYGQDEIASSLVLLPAIEIAQFRTHTWGDRVRGTYDEIADNGGAAGFVAGPEIHDWRTIDLAQVKINSSIDGGKPTSQNTGDRWRHPLDVAIGMINEICARGYDLGEGQYLSTGSSTVPQKLASGNHLIANFGVLGTVELEML